MKVTYEINRKALEYLRIPYHATNGVFKIADNGAAREFSLDNPKDLLTVVMKMGGITKDDVLEMFK